MVNHRPTLSHSRKWLLDVSLGRHQPGLGKFKLRMELPFEEKRLHEKPERVLARGVY
jgi:hypothetical protein